MKLRNLFLASLAVCTMASCSKDDDGISGPQEVDAYLSFASTTDVMTKASIDGGTDAGTDKEAKIQSLTAYVFDESGKYVISKHVSLLMEQLNLPEKILMRKTVRSRQSRLSM